MSYAGPRIIHDADSHIMESPDWLYEYADEATRAKMPTPDTSGTKEAEDDPDGFFAKALAKQRDPEYRANDEAELMLRKNWLAPGAFLKEERPAALDLLGFRSQLVFNTFANGMLMRAEHADDEDYAYGLAEAHNRAIIDFCSVDDRLLPVGYVPLMSIERACSFVQSALEAGVAAVMVASACPKTHSPSHVGLDPVWAAAQEAGVPIVFHVGGEGRPMPAAYFENGLPPVPDFHGGDGNFRSISYMSIPYPVMQTLSVLVIDGVFMRFPSLKFGAIELGATWLPGLMKNIDSSGEAFRRNEERLQKLELRPSEYLQRQLRVTPYPHEDAGWVIRECGEDVAMFSSDYPHVEGGRNPLKRFDRSLEGLPQPAIDRFYAANFEDLMGSALPAHLAVA
jgi:predicted TIM-barrel fold metal-dependent hydrolase